MKLLTLNFNLNDLKKPKESKLFLALVPTLKEKKTQQFTTLSLTFITIIFFGFFAIGPTFGTISDLQKQLDDNTFVNSALQKKIANLTILQSKYTQLQSQLTPLFNAVPTTPAVDVFVGQIHQLAQQSNIQLNRVQTLPVAISPTTVTAPYVAYTFTVEAQGDLPSLKQYMASLGNFNRLITFDAINYSRVGEIASTYRVTIRGEVYFKGGNE